MYIIYSGGEELETTVYADVLFLVNFSMDFITLWICSILSSKQRSAIKMSIASAVGGLYGVLAVIFSVKGILTYIFAVLISIIMSLIAFGWDSVFSMIKQSALIWTCGALLGGTVTALLSIGKNYTAVSVPSGGILAFSLAVSVVFVYILIRMICSMKNKKSATVFVRHNGREISFSALCDSGNLMRDPLGGDAVIPVSSKHIETLCGLKITKALLSVDTVVLENAGIDLRIIPHRTKDSDGLMAGFIPDRVTVVCGKKRNTVRCVLAPRDCTTDYFAGFSATLPYSLLP